MARPGSWLARYPVSAVSGVRRSFWPKKTTYAAPANFPWGEVERGRVGLGIGTPEDRGRDHRRYPCRRVREPTRNQVTRPRKL